MSLGLAVTLLLGLAPSAYILFATWRVRRFVRTSEPPQPAMARSQPVTVLKPLCGLDPELAENLRSFCRQRHSRFQIVFGVMDDDDPAIAVVREIMEEFPDLDLKLVIDPRVHGSNRKISNLINMVAGARHDFIVIADSDMRVAADYLDQVIAPLLQPGTGLVTCLYSGQTTRGLTSALGAMYINEWFLPSVLVSNSFGDNLYCFGATMAIRREVLEAVGGFESLSTYLADDYLLGEKVGALGLQVNLSRVVVENIIHEPDLSSLFAHELRWARTIRAVQPIGYALAFLTDAIPVSLLVGLISTLAGGPVQVAWVLIGFALVARILLHFTVAAAFGIRRQTPLWWIPVRDILTFAVRAASFMGRKVSWRAHALSVEAGSYLYNCDAQGQPDVEAACIVEKERGL